MMKNDFLINKKQSYIDNIIEYVVSVETITFSISPKLV